MRELILYEDYSREEVHDIFDRDSVFTPQAGTWGLQGIIQIPDQVDVCRPDGVFLLAGTDDERVADHVAVLDYSVLRACASADTFRDRVRRLVARFPSEPPRQRDAFPSSSRRATVSVQWQERWQRPAFARQSARRARRSRSLSGARLTG